MKVIPLTQGKFAAVDDEDFEKLNQHKWYAYNANRAGLKLQATWYAVRQAPRENGKQHTIWMHREILGLSDSAVQVDHWNGNGLDNRRQNIRSATRGQNQQNRRKTLGCSSRFKGVYWEKLRGRWRAEIRIAGKLHFLGYFVNEDLAATAYAQAAKEHFGEFALVNV